MYRGGVGRAIIDFARWWLALPIIVLCGLALYVLLKFAMESFFLHKFVISLTY